MNNNPSSPSLWLLLGDKIGDNAQALALEERLGLKAVHKNLQYRASRIPNPLKGASLATLNKKSSDTLDPPWPDLVIATGRRSVPIARWIKSSSGGRTKLVQVGRPRADSSTFDLVITTPQYRISPAPNVTEMPLPFTHLQRPRLVEEAAQMVSPWSDLPSPRIAVLIGGESTTSHFGPALGKELGEGANQLAKSLGGSLMILSGRRTLSETKSALLGAVTVPHKAHSGQSQNGNNPYIGALGLADAVIVTTDSASMLADAMVTGKPVLIFDVPSRAKRPTDRLGDRLYGSRLHAPVAGLAQEGWISLPRRMDLLVEGLSKKGLVSTLGSVLEAGNGLPEKIPSGEIEAAWEAAVERIKNLLN